MLFIYGFTFKNFILLTFFIICGGLMLVAIAVILGSLSFWFSKSDIISDTANSLMTNFASYPDGIFKGTAKILLFTLIPVGIVNYLPVHVISSFDLIKFLIIIGVTIFLILLAFIVFYKGLKKYSSSNLMIARI